MGNEKHEKHKVKKFMDVDKIVPGINKIAVLRANALGDFLVALPALNALRTTYPQAEIVLLGKPWHAAFLKNRPGPVDRVVVVPPYPGVRDERDQEMNSAEVDEFFAAMQKEHFDLALQIHGGGKNSNPFVLRLGARMTAGLKTPDAAPLDRWVPYYFYHTEIMRYLEVVSLVGAKTCEIVPNLAVTKADLVESEAVVPDGDKPIAILHPGASDSRRRWPLDKFAAVGDALARAGARVVVAGIESEHDLVEGILNTMQEDVLNICGRLSIGGFAGLLKRSALLVANDSGPRHMAVAVGTPTVGIFWCGNVITFGPFTRSDHRVAIAWRIHCPVCGSMECNHRDSFVFEVTTEEVTEMALDLLDRYKQRTKALAGTQTANA